jgi:hypothetical protein
MDHLVDAVMEQPPVYADRLIAFAEPLIPFHPDWAEQRINEGARLMAHLKLTQIEAVMAKRDKLVKQLNDAMDRSIFRYRPSGLRRVEGPFTEDDRVR